jgi:hypothetical protein
MMLDGSCGHRTMIRRPSDIILVVDRWLMDIFVVICEWKKYSTLYVLSQKIKVGAAHFFQPLTKDLELSFVIEYPYLICRAWSVLSKSVLTLF